MISQQELQQLASFECHRPNEVAISFYFQPGRPQDKSHKEEGILAKDLLRRTLQELQLNGLNHAASEDLRKILQLAERLHGNQARAKAVFACAGRGFWQEFDLPPMSSPTRLFVNTRFHLKPLAPIFSEHPRLWVALVDRQSARFLEMQFEQIREQGSLNEPLSPHGRSDGYLGYDAGHAQRHVDDEARRHFRKVAEVLKDASEKKKFDALVIACRDVNWQDLERHLHPDVQKKLLGRFSSDIGSLTDDRIRREAGGILRESLHRHQEVLIREALDGAKSNGRGVTGLRRVLRAMELGEVESIIMTEEYSARAVECTACGHLDSHLVPYCPACGRSTRELPDVCEVLVPAAIRNHIGFVLVPQQDSLDRVGNIAALLRFRSDRNTNQMQQAS